MKVAFVEGFERQGETWEDRLKEARELRELFHDVFGPSSPVEADEAEYDPDAREPEELEIEGARACVFWSVVETRHTPDEALVQMFKCLEKVPDLPPRKIAEWAEYVWHKEFCRQRRCWLDLSWDCEASGFLTSRTVLGPDGGELFDDRQRWTDPNDWEKGRDKPNLVSDPPFEKVVGERLSEYALKWAASGGHLPKAVRSE